ncbi:histidine kinase [Thermosipho melanesiensis]|uniref:Signal transduction histidine kinase, LytS n=2 Tax=Thermosipho melanesiensis TaxID=46541 RepID=A6LJ91_THEM4|nr:LytS/YhcK type 5TM receptor domain-containing protein [Thermosipho melanesiensis]ABR29992.1 signal transduction histidine kinase, LytS [Thermosipho melanesiensis BI429]APT73196.1 histidine kinase [Thermosipho melanesiensis]OOC38591.1 histidine kinase [Thermosipho melanesiensis]OOC40395.1 histidine kinase [Thermosipho melanesiensis]OOC40659.1 histidine kinase [Thermosipho melanesiensis]
MLTNISLILLERVSLILVITYIIFQTYFIKNIFGRSLVTKNKMVIGFIGGFLGILGTLFGIRYNGAIVNYRDIGVILSGMLAGVSGGIVAAFISASFRLFLGGITAVPCFLGTLTAGIISGVLSEYYGRKHFTFFRTMYYTILIEIIHLMYVLLMVKPFYLAYDITFKILFPMVITNTLGVSFLNFMMWNLEEKLQNVEENTISSIFVIMERILNTIEIGFNENSAILIAQVILENTDFDAVALTDKEYILAHVGIGDDHHISGEKIKTQATKKVINSGYGLKVVGKKGINCEKENCPLFSAIVIPLNNINGDLIGTLKLYYSKSHSMQNKDIIFGKKLAQVLSLIISISEINESLKLATEEKMRELMSNMSPHFLFNTLNAIKYISRREPQRVDKFIDNLSSLLRYTLYENSKLVSVRNEVDFTKNYLELMKLRFEDKLNYEVKVAKELEEYLIPPFILQPLVENSIKHGMKGGKLLIRISISKSDKKIKICVEDNGKGFSEMKKTGKGLLLIKKRLKVLFGDNYVFNIKNNFFGGVVVEIKFDSKVGELI